MTESTSNQRVIDYAYENPRPPWRPRRSLHSRIASKITRRVILITTGSSALVILLWLWILSMQHAAQQEAACAARLRELGSQLILYCDCHAELPPSTISLHHFMVRYTPRAGTEESIERQREHFRESFTWAMCCPDGSKLPEDWTLNKPTSGDFVFAAPGLRAVRSAPPNTVLMYESACRHRGGMNVLFASGQVRWLNAKESADILADLAGGKNPPPSLNAKK